MEDWLQNKKDYRAFCKLHGELPVFFQDWWLDVVCEHGSWDVCLFRDKGGEIRGVLPFYIAKKYASKVIIKPDLTPYLGVWLKYPDNLEREIAINKFEKKAADDLIDQLPKVTYYAQQHPISLKNHLPFYRKGFKQTTRYTFFIEKGKSKEEAWASIDSSVRNKVRKAEALPIRIEASRDVELFYKTNQKSFERQSLKVPYTFDFLKKIDTAILESGQGQILFAIDKENQIHAAMYLVWDNATIYNWMLGGDTKHNKSGAVQLLLWTGIQKAIQENKNFDFEGGMMKNIEPVFSAFGGTLQPYFKIYKGGNFIFKILSALKNG